MSPTKRMTFHTCSTCTSSSHTPLCRDCLLLSFSGSKAWCYECQEEPAHIDCSGLCFDCANYQEDDYEDQGQCTNCPEPATVCGYCADCYWEEDAKRKHERRNNVNWRFQRAYSSGIQLLGLSHEKALELAHASVQTFLESSSRPVTTSPVNLRFGEEPGKVSFS